MKSEDIQRIFEIAGHISLEAFSTIASNAGLDFKLGDLAKIEMLVESRQLTAIQTKGFILYGLPRAEASLDDVAAILLECFGKDEYSLSKAAKCLGRRSHEINVLMAELEGAGKIKHTRDGKYMGQPYPIFKNLT
jgi:hypothetical protein